MEIDWFDLLAVKGTLESLVQHHRSKASNSLGLSLENINTRTHVWLTAGKREMILRSGWGSQGET